jgi:hypothetical protein
VAHHRIGHLLQVFRFRPHLELYEPIQGLRSESHSDGAMEATGLSLDDDEAPTVQIPAQRPPEENVGPITTEMRRGYRKIPSVRLVEFLRHQSRPRSCWAIYLALLSQWPLGLNLILYAIHPPWAAVKGRAMLWIAGFGISAAFMLLSADLAWTFPTKRAAHLDQLVHHDPRAENVSHWLARYMSYPVQLLLPIAGAVSGPIYLYIIRVPLERVVGISFASYVLVSWVSLVGGNILYWLWVAPGLAKQLYRCRDIDLRWQDPAATPGIRLLADAYGVSALFLLVGVVTISGLNFWVPRVTSAPAALYTLFAFFAVAVVTSIRLTVVPMVWVWLAMVRHKRATLEIIDKQMPSLGSGVSVRNPAVEKLVVIYQSVATAPALPFSTSAMVQYGAALSGSIVAFFVGLLARR